MDNETPKVPSWFAPGVVAVKQEKNEAEVVRAGMHPLNRCFPNYKSTPEKTQPTRELPTQPKRKIQTHPKRALIKSKFPLSRNPGKVAQKLRIENAQRLLELLVTQTQAPPKRR